MSFFLATVNKLSGSAVNRVRTQLHRYLASPQSEMVKKEVLASNFNFIDLTNSIIRNEDNNNRIKSVNMLNTSEGTKFNALISNKKLLINYDILVNIEEQPLDLLPKLQSIEASIISEDNKCADENYYDTKDIYKENRALSFVFFWLNLIEAGNNKLYNDYIIDQSIFK
eukprot:310723_1